MILFAKSIRSEDKTNIFVGYNEEFGKISVR